MNARELKPAHASGRRFIIGLGVGFVVLAAGLYVGLKGFVRHAQDTKPPEIPLRWEQREAWPSEPVLPFELEYDSMVQAETGKTYRNATFALDADPVREKAIETILLACADKARDARTFAADGTGPFLESRISALEQARFPPQFYPAYLLASWHALRGDPAQYDAWMAKTAAISPAFLREDGHAPGETAPSIRIAFDRLRTLPKKHPSFWERLAHHTKEQALDRNLVLVYPAPVADAKGRVWLPVFRDMYRWDSSDPAPRPSTGSCAGKDAWFSMDSTRVGRLNGPGAKAPKRP